MSSCKVAVVTGGNKGIGYAIVKGLCEKFDGNVYLTARDVKRGEQAIEKLKRLGFNPFFHQLDITDQQSIDTFKNYIKTKYDGIDILVNNAAIAYHRRPIESETVPVPVQATEIMEINYFGTLNLCEALFPLLRQNGRVINVSSAAGHLSYILSADFRTKFRECSSIDDVTKIVKTYLQDTVEENIEQERLMFPYVVSKNGISAFSIIQQKLFDAEIPCRNISINAVHPGFVDTDMTDHKGTLTIEEGARAPLFLALDSNLKGKFVWKDCTVIDWDAPSLPEPY